MVPIALNTLIAGSSRTVTLIFPGAAGSAGAKSTIKISGAYAGGAFGGSTRVTLP